MKSLINYSRQTILFYIDSLAAFLLPDVDIDSFRKEQNNPVSSVDTNLQSKVNCLQDQASLLARAVKSVLLIEHDEEFLKTIYIPFLAYFISNDLSKVKPSPQSKFIYNLIELDAYFYGSELQVGPSDYAGVFPAGPTNFALSGTLNIYERIVFKLFFISFSKVILNPAPEFLRVNVDYAARSKLQKHLCVLGLDIPNIFYLIPVALFENLPNVSSDVKVPDVSCHWLGPVGVEAYLFYLAAIKKTSTVVIGQPHGGGYCQIYNTSSYELTERALSDFFLAPSWTSAGKVFPNWRASRNLFLAQKWRFLCKKKKNRMLVIMPYFYMHAEPAYLESYYIGKTMNSYGIDQLKNLKEHFDGQFDFKLYPRQKGISAEILGFLHDYFPESEFVSTSSVLELAQSYDGVIHIDSNGTAIIELAASRIPQYVYVGPELKLLDSYKNFLWMIKLKSTRPHLEAGCYVLINNLRYRRAYGASYCYPFFFIALIRACQRWIKLLAKG